MLGYHDIVVGNEPDVFLTRFLHEMLPDAIEAARDGFNNYRSLLGSFGDGEISTPVCR